jgi:hypothetical protein
MRLPFCFIALQANVISHLKPAERPPSVVKNYEQRDQREKRELTTSPKTLPLAALFISL